jgi:predicted RNase H-like HicB family nuclease
MRFLVMVRPTGTGYSVDVPDLPGCVSVGKTVEGSLRRIREAMKMHLELMKESGEPAPTPRRQIEFAIDETAGEELCTWVDLTDAPVAAI